MSALIIEFGARHHAQAPQPTAQEPRRPDIVRERRERFLAAEMKVEYLERLRSLAWAAQNAVERCGMKEAEQYANLDDGYGLLDRMRQASAEWMLTPAPTRAALDRKRKFRVSAPFKYLPIVDVAAVDRLLAADDDYLRSANPSRYRRPAGRQS